MDTGDKSIRGMFVPVTASLPWLHNNNEEKQDEARKPGKNFSAWDN